MELLPPVTRASATADEGLFRIAFQAAGVGMFIVDADRRIVDANDAFGELLGYEPSELVGRTVPEITPADDQRLSDDFYDGIVRHELDGVSLEKRYLHRDGYGVWVQLTASPVRSEDGELEYIVAQVENLTRLRESERALERALARQTLVMEHAPDVIVVGNLDGTIHAASRSLEGVLGYTEAEVVGRSFIELVSPDSLAEGARWLEIAVANGRVRVPQLSFRHRDGSERLLEGEVVLGTSDLGSPAFLIATARDITDRRRLEEELRQAQKMEAVGQLAGGIAHDFNNLLTVISGYTSLAIGLAGDDPRLASDLAAVQDAAGRAADLTAQLLSFSRRRPLKVAAFDPNSVLTGVGMMLSRLIGEEIDVTSQLAYDLGTVTGDEGALEQCLLNLAVNARDAMPNGGTLSLESSALDVERDVLLAEGLDASRPAFMCISVRDTGDGMDAATKARIFEPFFTTKEQSEGTGLGLAMVYAIVRQMGGFIRVTSEPGEGTRFDLYFPRDGCVVAESTSAA